MISTLGITGYQSIDTAFMRFGMINLIVGANFSGKSAILRALRAACLGQTGDEFIRHGEDAANVELTLLDGSDSTTTLVGWQKLRKVSASYSMGSRTWLKVGQHVPEDVQKILGVQALEIDKSWSVTPQFHMQWDQPLVGQSGSRMARLLGTMTNLHFVVQAQMLNRKDREKAARDATTAQEEGGRLREQLGGLNWVGDARTAVSAAEQGIVDARVALTRFSSDVEAVATHHLLGKEHRGLEQRYQSTVGPLGLAEEWLGWLETDTALVSKHQALEEGRNILRGQREQLQVALVVAESAYKEACQEAGVCDTCPWRE